MTIGGGAGFATAGRGVIATFTCTKAGESFGTWGLTKNIKLQNSRLTDRALEL